MTEIVCQQLLAPDMEFSASQRRNSRGCVTSRDRREKMLTFHLHLIDPDSLWGPNGYEAGIESGWKV
jgi:hypothetical protein